MNQKKTILFLLNRECFFLPPFMTLIDVLCKEYHIKIISYETSDSINKVRSLYKDKDVSFLIDTTQPNIITLGQRVKRRLKKYFGIKSVFHNQALKLLKSEQYDILWIIHEKTLDEFKNDLRSNKYVVSVYELNDNDKGFLDRMKEPLQNAKAVIVPEYNRANILRVWENLPQTPLVLPNKPNNHPRIKFIDNKYSDILYGKKIILYQGYIQKIRNLDAICKACSEYKDYTLVLMGTGDLEYIENLKASYPNIIHLPFVIPPEHLNITSYAHIGIVKYDYVSLNCIFCAPNKTWEYAGFGIPILAHNIPGLQYTVGKHNAGICCNLDDVEEIKRALKTIEDSYELYMKNSINFFDSCNIEAEIKSIASTLCS